jgi:hypothetical protein
MGCIAVKKGCSSNLILWPAGGCNMFPRKSLHPPRRVQLFCGPLVVPAVWHRCNLSCDWQSILHGHFGCGPGDQRDNVGSQTSKNVAASWTIPSVGSFRVIRCGSSSLALTLIITVSPHSTASLTNLSKTHLLGILGDVLQREVNNVLSL